MNTMVLIGAGDWRATFPFSEYLSYSLVWAKGSTLFPLYVLDTVSQWLLKFRSNKDQQWESRGMSEGK